MPVSAPVGFGIRGYADISYPLPSLLSPVRDNALACVEDIYDQEKIKTKEKMQDLGKSKRTR